jgi:hypothetical protein
MKVEHKNFIGFYKNVYPEGYCQHLIKEFERLEKSGAGSNRQRSEGASKHIKDDFQIGINLRNHRLEPFEWTEKQENNIENKLYMDSVELFFNGLQRCYDEYSEKYSILLENGSIRASAMKMQRTDPGGGYHIWHAEHGPNEHSNRVVVYSLYLNNLDGQGGETEFLYQKLRIKPEENFMLMWPASFTHTHRGNIVLGEKHKYIVTGWFYYD